MLQWGKPTCQLMMVRKINSRTENTNGKPEHSLLPTHSPQKEHQIRQGQAVRDGERQKQNHSVLTPKNRWKQEHCSPQNWPNICLSQSRWVTAVSLPITARALCPCRVLGECLQGNLSIAVLLYDCTQQSKTVFPRTFPQITEQATSVQWAPPNILYWDTKVLCGMVANPTVSDFTYVPGGLLLEASASCLMANKTS